MRVTMAAIARSHNKLKENSGLGKSLAKEKGRGRKGKGRGKEEAWLHVSELQDGYEWGRLNLRSVTEENSLDEFLRTAELAGTEFTAEKRNISVIHERYTGLPDSKERRKIEEAQELCKQDLYIPRRPHWDESTTPEQLELSERDAFLKWRRHLASLEERDKILLTPFEKNLEFWRQLWRVIERSDIVVQIVDARNPLLFRCKDLEKYVREIGPDKVNMLLINKSDLLTPEQRCIWSEYFNSNVDATVAFWSAKAESQESQQDTQTSTDDERDTEETNDQLEGHPTIENDEHPNLGNDNLTIGSDDATIRNDDAIIGSDDATIGNDNLTIGSDDSKIESDSPTIGSYSTNALPNISDTLSSSTDISFSSCTSDLLTSESLLELFTKIAPVTKRPVTVGLVGYPNVGKSSTINTLLQAKRVPVSATPGRTKHFQTLHVSNDVILCDCPGLVFPNFINTKADMVCNGILPIDQMRDHTPPVSIVCQQVPRPVLERFYGICIPLPLEGEDPLRPPLSHELLSSYGYSRGFMTAHGQPDQSRAARYILKDYVNGRLLYCEPPPSIDPVEFNRKGQEMYREETGSESGNELSVKELSSVKTDTPNFDAVFFKQREGFVHSKRPSGTVLGEGRGATGRDKPWKKHHNYKKKEKTRRIIGDSTPYNYF